MPSSHGFSSAVPFVSCDSQPQVLDVLVQLFDLHDKSVAKDIHEPHVMVSINFLPVVSQWGFILQNRSSPEHIMFLSEGTSLMID